MISCALCGEAVREDDSWYFAGKGYCSRECSHAAGDTRRCIPGSLLPCSCTAYSKRRRMLRDTRIALSVAERIHDASDLIDAYDEAVSEAGVGYLPLAAHVQIGKDGPDEASDCEDPEQTLRDQVQELSGHIQDLRNLEAVVQGAATMLATGRLTKALEHSRMEAEDLRGQLWRAEESTARPGARLPPSRRQGVCRNSLAAVLGSGFPKTREA